MELLHKLQEMQARSVRVHTRLHNKQEDTVTLRFADIEAIQ